MAITKVNNDLQDALAAAQPTITSVGTLTGLTVSGTASVTHATANEYVATFQNSGNNNKLKIGNNSSGYINIQGARVDNGNPYNLSLQTEGGNVGVGAEVVSSWTKLQVAGTAGAQTGAKQALYVTSPSAVAGEGVGIRMSASSGSHEAVGIIGMVNNASGNSGSMTFHTYNGGATIPEVARFDNSGNLLVGTTALSAAGTAAKLQVNSEILSRGSSAGLFWTNRNGTVTSGTNWAGWYSTAANHFLYSNAANRASIGITSGTYTALSDANKKKDFEDSTVGLDAVMQLKPKTYRMLEDADDAPKYLGFIAQDVEHIIPEAYVESTSVDAGGTESTFIGLTDRPFIAALTKAMQEQQSIIETLTARITALEGE
jgi:hypothetical protein